MTQMTTNIQKSSQSTAFQQQAGAVLGRLREALARALADGGTGNALRTATDLHRLLGINSKLSWQLHKLATSSDPLTAGVHVPKPAAMRRFLDAAAVYGVSAEKIEAISAAMRDFEGLITIHAGERITFDSMISAVAGGEAADQNDLQHRRQAFRAQSYIFGTQAAVRLGCYMVQRNEDGLTIDMASIGGLVGLRRFKTGASCVLGKARMQDGDTATPPKDAFEPLDPSGQQPHGVSFVTDFCTQPIPEIQNSVDRNGYVTTRLTNQTVGNTGAVTAILGDVMRQAESRFREPHNPDFAVMMGINKPYKVLLFDLMVREGTYGDPTPVPRGVIYNDADEPQLPLTNRKDILSENVPVVYMGKGPSVLHTADVPRYAEMAQYAFDKLGWDGERFEVYRCRVEYPVMMSSVVMQFGLPERPEDDEEPTTNE